MSEKTFNEKIIAIQSELKDLIYYNPATGIILRKDRRNANGSIDAYGYLIIKIRGVQFKAHRLAWVYFYGKEPDYNIDHINRDKLDNRIINLRDVPQSVNVKNTVRVNKDTNCVGIHYDTITNGLLAKYTTRINGKTFRYRTLQEAKNKRTQNGLMI